MATAESPGLLIEMTRLNVPCDSGGYIIFSDQNVLCGKLEDLAMNERIYYYASHRNTSVVLHKNPLFSLNYKLVDYCYNVTLTSRNDSILLEPKYDLECFFKIHLPYGNQIELDLLTNYYTKLNAGDGGGGVIERKSDPTISVDDIDYEYVDLTAPQYLTNRGRCTGISVRIDDPNANKNWTHCIRGEDDAKKISFKSAGNSIFVYVTKTIRTSDAVDELDMHVDGHNANRMPSIYFEYNAATIPEIVSQCAFGWIAVHQFCITAMETALPWHQAEDECKGHGGHLASIKSEREQKLIDTLLMNRYVSMVQLICPADSIVLYSVHLLRGRTLCRAVDTLVASLLTQFWVHFMFLFELRCSATFKESAAYWVGASDDIFEGDFRWTNGFPYTYSNWFPGWIEHNHYNKQPNDDGKPTSLIN